MKKSPFYSVRNTKLTFEVEDNLSDTKDSAGNSVPGKKKVLVEAFLKPAKSNSRIKFDDYNNLGVSEEYLEGFLVKPFDGYPAGVGNLSKTTEAIYRDQKGEFTVTIKLQNCVKADLMTGYPIAGLFRVIGGQ